MTIPSGSLSKQSVAPFRLRRHADFQRAYKASRKHHSASLSYFFRLRPVEEQPPAAGPRIGLTVGKVMGNAVARNRIKRRLREAVRLNLAILHDAPPKQRDLDLVLHPRKSVATMEFTALEREIARLFAQVVSMAAHPQSAPPPRPPKARGVSRTSPGKSSVPATKASSAARS